MSPAHVPSPADRETGPSFARAAGPAWRDHAPVIWPLRATASDIHTLVVRSSHCFVTAANAFLKLFDQVARLRTILRQPLRVAP